MNMIEIDTFCKIITETSSMHLIKSLGPDVQGITDITNQNLAKLERVEGWR